MHEWFTIADLSAAEIGRLLAEPDDETAPAVEAFIEQIGGLENARLAVELLSELERCA